MSFLQPWYTQLHDDTLIHYNYPVRSMRKGYAFGRICLFVCVWPKMPIYTLISQVFLKKWCTLLTHPPGMFARSIEIAISHDSVHIIVPSGCPSEKNPERNNFLNRRDCLFCNIMVKTLPSLEVVKPTVWYNINAGKPTPAWQHCIEIAVIHSLYSTVHWQWSVCTGCVLFGSLAIKWMCIWLA